MPAHRRGAGSVPCFRLDGAITFCAPAHDADPLSIAGLAIGTHVLDTQPPSAATVFDVLPRPGGDLFDGGGRGARTPAGAAADALPPPLDTAGSPLSPGDHYPA